MAPPPIPVDPAIDSWRPSNSTISLGLGLDHLLQIPPRYSDRQGLPSQSSLDAFPQELQLPAMKQNPAEPDPLLRFWNEPGPWNAQRIGGDVRQTPATTHFTSYGDPTRRSPHALPYDYRSPRSEVGSSTTGTLPMDSGYGGSRSLATASARSVDHFDQTPSSHSISGDVQDFHLYPEEFYQEPSVCNGPSPNPQYSSTNVTQDPTQQTAVSFELACQYPSCCAVSKNQSEYR